MTEAIIYEHDTANGFAPMEFPSKNAGFTMVFPGKEVVWRPDGVGVPIDPEVVGRTFTCTANLTSTEVNTLYTWMKTPPAAGYGVYPRMKFYLDSTTYWDDPNWIKCMIVGVVKGASLADSKWAVTVTFTERT